jgi:hypothetical protein
MKVRKQVQRIKVAANLAWIGTKCQLPWSLHTVANFAAPFYNHNDYADRWDHYLLAVVLDKELTLSDAWESASAECAFDHSMWSNFHHIKREHNLSLLQALDAEVDYWTNHLFVEVPNYQLSDWEM